ncbi:acyltransferase [Xylogone sp. PMI_703]|nr:acyltransferase [Xylogone sp. PMI_703]
MLRPLRNLVASVLPAGILDNNSYALITSNENSSPALKSNENVFSRVKLSVQRFGFFILPSPIQKRLRPAQFKPQRLYPTSYLDGLRGVASLIVFFCHYTEGNMGSYTHSYGLPKDAKVHSSPLQLPFLRVVYSGRPMVHIFFVISGFVLSYKPLKLARARNWSSLQNTLSSSVFRRAMRLFIPTTTSTFMIMLLIRFRWMGKPMPSFWAQFWDWMHAVWKITFSWKWDITQFLPYDVHLWTIPIEMSCSMLLFVTIMGMSRCKVYLRLIILLGIMFYCLKCQHWAAFEFLGGMFIAEIGLIQIARAERDANKEAATASSSPTPITTEVKPAGPSRGWTIFWWINFVIAMFLAGWPNQGAKETPIIKHLVPITIDPYFTTGGDLVSFPWFALGAIQTVFACQQLPALQRFFTTGIAQYLANLSYALYLMHGPCLDVFAHRVMPHVWALVGGAEGAGMFAKMFVWFVGLCCLSIPVFWSADVFWRAVDTPSVQFAKWVEDCCIVKED